MPVLASLSDVVVATASSILVESIAVSSVLTSLPSLRALDCEVVTYLAGCVADGDIFDAASLEAVASPFFDSFALADISSEEMTVLCKSIAAALSKAELFSVRTSGLGMAGINLETAAALRAALGSDAVDGDARGAGSRVLAAPIKLGSSGAREGDAVILDLLWARESNRFLHANKAMEGGFSERDRAKAAKLAAKKDTRVGAAADFARKLQEGTAAAELAAATRAGRLVAVTSGAVTYVPVIDRRPQDIHLMGVNLGYGGELLIENAELHLAQGRRYGLIGRNGYGKTTLLKAMARHDVQGAGNTSFPTNIRVLHVDQEISAGPRTVLETVLSADVERDMLFKEERDLIAALAASKDDDGEGGGGGGGRAAGSVSTITAATGGG